MRVNEVNFRVMTTNPAANAEERREELSMRSNDVITSIFDTEFSVVTFLEWFYSLQEAVLNEIPKEIVPNLRMHEAGGVHADALVDFGEELAVTVPTNIQSIQPAKMFEGTQWAVVKQRLADGVFRDYALERVLSEAQNSSGGVVAMVLAEAYATSILASLVADLHSESSSSIPTSVCDLSTTLSSELLTQNVYLSTLSSTLNIQRQDWTSHSPFLRNKRITPGVAHGVSLLRRSVWECVVAARKQQSSMGPKLLSVLSLKSWKSKYLTSQCNWLRRHCFQLIGGCLQQWLQAYRELAVSRTRLWQWQLDLLYLHYSMQQTAQWIVGQCSSIFEAHGMERIDEEEDVLRMLLYIDFLLHISTVPRMSRVVDLLSSFVQHPNTVDTEIHGRDLLLPIGHAVHQDYEFDLSVDMLTLAGLTSSYSYDRERGPPSFLKFVSSEEASRFETELASTCTTAGLEAGHDSIGFQTLAFREILVQRLVQRLQELKEYSQAEQTRAEFLFPVASEDSIKWISAIRKVESLFVSPFESQDSGDGIIQAVVWHRAELISAAADSAKASSASQCSPAVAVLSTKPIYPPLSASEEESLGQFRDAFPNVLHM